MVEAGPAIEVIELTKRYGEVPVVDDISLSLSLAMDTVKQHLDSFQQMSIIRIESNTIHLTDGGKLDSIAENFGLRT